MDNVGQNTLSVDRDTFVGHERKLTTVVALTVLLFLTGCAPKLSERVMGYLLNMPEEKLVDYYNYVNGVNSETLGIGHVDLPQELELTPLRELLGQRKLHSLRVLNWMGHVLVERDIRSPASYAVEAVRMNRDQVSVERFNQVVMEAEQFGTRSLDISKFDTANLSVLYDAILTASAQNDVKPQLLITALLYSGGNLDNPWGVPQNKTGSYLDMADYVAKYFNEAMGAVTQLPLDDPVFINSYLPYDCWADYGRDISIEEKREIVKFLALVEHFSNGDLGYGRTSYTLPYVGTPSRPGLMSYDTLIDIAKQRVARFNALVRLGNGLTNDEISIMIKDLRIGQAILSQQERRIGASVIGSRRHESSRADRRQGLDKGRAVRRSTEGQLTRVGQMLDAVYGILGVVDNVI